MSPKLLVLENLSKYYTSTQSVVVGLNSIRLSFDKGEFVAITGESGSGKSTMAHVLGGILPYESGELYVSGNPTSHYDGSDWERYRRDNISFISQNYGILVSCTVLENVVSALRLTGIEKAQAEAQAEAILKEVELWELRTRRAAKLSSGQKQRLSIARALAKPAPILIADEPTGNLDPENSAKIMELLSHAAKERLVILITHEFEEAQDLATRHIVMQDGHVVMDAQLRQANPPQPEEHRPAPKKKALSPYVSRLQLAGRPVWFTLVLLFFTLTAFAVFSFLGTFIVALDDTSTRIYDNSAFRNGNQERIIVSTLDHSPMTDADYEAILDVSYVQALEPYGYVTDINYAYREGTDYSVISNRQDTGTWDNADLSITQYISLNKNAPFMKTIPMTAGDSAFLSAGRLPEQFNEVVLHGSADAIGSKLTVYIQDMKNWGTLDIVPLRVTVVGVTDYGTGLFFHGDIGRIFTHRTLAIGTYTFMRGTEKPDQALLRTGMSRLDLSSMPMLIPNAALGDDVCRLSQKFYDLCISRGTGALLMLNVNLEDPDLMDASNYTHLTFLSEENSLGLNPWHDYYYNNFVEVSPAVFDRLSYAAASDQVSLTIRDYAYTQRVLDALHEMGYLAISPFKESSTKVNPSLAAQRMQTLTVCAAALVAIFALQIIVLRALFGTQIESYKLLSNIGLACSTAKASILWQVLLFTLFGQLLGGGLIVLCSSLGIQRIVHLTRYLPPVYVLLLIGVHLSASLIATVWIVSSMTRQVYPLAGKQTDLELEEEEVRV